MKYTCNRCKARVKGKGLESHYESARCDDRLEAYNLGRVRGANNEQERWMYATKVLRNNLPKLSVWHNPDASSFEDMTKETT